MRRDRALASAVEVESARDGVAARRPHGVRFGVLVHAVLAVVDLDGDAAAVAAATALQARLLGTSAEETAAAAATVRRALAHPADPPRRRGRARGAVPARGRRSRVRLDDGTLVEGVADLAFREDEPTPTWTVVDFKTDLDVDRPPAGVSLAARRSTPTRSRGRPRSRPAPSC